MARETNDVIRQRYLDYLARCGQVFTPFAPIQLLDFFAGRNAEVQRVIDEVGAPGRQLAILGNRGVGKTSLAALAPFFAGRDDEDCPYVRCTQTSTFDSILSEVLADVDVHLGLNGIESSQGKSAGAAIGPLTGAVARDVKATYRALSPPQKITPKLLLQHFGARRGLIIIDEYDRVQDSETHVQVAELLKHFSDARSESKILIVGVAETLRQLIGEHESLTRCLAPIRLDPMRDEELVDIIQRGERRLQLVFRERAKAKIVRLADGFPHFVHLIGRACAKAAGRVLEENPEARPIVGDDEYKIGLRAALDDAEPKLVEDYERAVVTVKRKSERFELVLWAMALSDERDVQVRDIATFASYFTGEDYSAATFNYQLGKLVLPERSHILTRVREGYYKFTNALMRPYIRLRLELENVVSYGGQLAFPFMKRV